MPPPPPLPDFKHKFNKTEIKNWLPIDDSIWDLLDWEDAVTPTAAT